MRTCAPPAVSTRDDHRGGDECEQRRSPARQLRVNRPPGTLKVAEELPPKNTSSPPLNRTSSPAIHHRHGINLGGLLGAHGRVQFAGQRGAVYAHFMQLKASASDFNESLALRALDWMEKEWELTPASVVISITGGAQDFALEARLHEAFAHGLARAAQATNAKIFTGGTDSGVMRIVGRALQEHHVQCACLGVAVWNKVLGREKLEDCSGDLVELPREAANSNAGVNLEPNHTHFALIDGGEQSGWGSEIDIRFEMESAYCKKYQVPRVLVVVQGGPNTLLSVQAAINKECPVVLVRDSGGVAELLDRFLRDFSRTDRKYSRSVTMRELHEYDCFRRMLNSFKEEQREVKKLGLFKQMEHIARINQQSQVESNTSSTGGSPRALASAKRIHSFAMSGADADDGPTADLDLHLLTSVINDVGQCAPQARLRLAVEWNRVDYVSKLLKEDNDLVSLTAALQSALENHRPEDSSRVEVIKLLLAHKSVLVERLDFLRLYWRTAYVNDRPLFRSDTALHEQLNRQLTESLKDDRRRSMMRRRADDDTIQATSLRAYHRTLYPFLRQYLPMMGPRLQKLAERRESLSTHDLLYWAVLCADCTLAETFWRMSTRNCDPIRTALMAAQAAQKAAVVCPPAQAAYRDMASHFEGLATALLSKCRTQDDATLVLLRASPHWPKTILRLAMDGKHKNFVGQTFVQTLVEDFWHGKSFRDQYQLPRDVNSIHILLHPFVKQIDMESNWDAAINLSAQRFGSRITFGRFSNLGSTTATAMRFKNHAMRKMRTGLPQETVAKTDCCSRLHDTLSSSFLFRYMHGQERDEIAGFFRVPRVKFVYKLVSYLLFLLLFTYVLTTNAPTDAPYHGLSWADSTFIVWVGALWIEEMHQWLLDYKRGASHLDTWNVLDISSLTLLLFVFPMRITAILRCGLGKALTSSENMGVTWEQAYDDCLLLWYTQVVLAFMAIACWVRLLYWLTVLSRRLGIFFVILLELGWDVAYFCVIWSICLAGFPAAFVGLMPGLNGSLPEAEQLLIWAMLGEYGDYPDIQAIGTAASSVLALYVFVANVLLVNLLIAMMTETYERIKKNAEDEWQYRRVFIVDEFSGSVYPIPAPLSLPFLVLEILFTLPMLIKDLCDFMKTSRSERQSARYYPLPPEACVEDLSPTRPPLHPPSSYEDNSNLHPGDRGLVNARRTHKNLFRVGSIASPEVSQATAFEHGRVSTCLRWIFGGLSGDGDDLLFSHLSIETLKEKGWLHKEPDLVMLREYVRDKHKPNEDASLPEQLRRILAEAEQRQQELASAGLVQSLSRAHSNPEATVVTKPTGIAGSKNARKETDEDYWHEQIELIQQQLPLEKQRGVLEERARWLAAQQLSLLSSFSTREMQAADGNGPSPTLHVKARGHHKLYPKRFEVPRAKVDWRVEWPEYQPVAYTAEVVKANNVRIKKDGWADPEDPLQVRDSWRTRRSFEGPLLFDATGAPLNPRGRTGMKERGLLGKWGPNHAADPIVTRRHPITGKVQMVSIKRSDTGEWAIPGGIVDAGETVSQAVRREFMEEAMAFEDDATRTKYDALVQELFSQGTMVYRGYVDDPRNTDHAWMETSAFHFHCNSELGKMLPLQAGDDAAAVTWLSIDAADVRYKHLYASHKEWVDGVAKRLSES